MLTRRAVLLRKPVGSASVVIHATYSADEESTVEPDLVRLLRSTRTVDKEDPRPVWVLGWGGTNVPLPRRRGEMGPEAGSVGSRA